MIAALELNRTCYGFEIKKDFYNLAIKRIEKAKKYKEENKTFFDFQKESEDVNKRYKQWVDNITILNVKLNIFKT